MVSHHLFIEKFVIHKFSNKWQLNITSNAFSIATRERKAESENHMRTHTHTQMQIHIQL